MFIKGITRDVGVMVRSQLDNSAETTGPIYILFQALSGDNKGKFFSTAAGGSWDTRAAATLPSGAHAGGGVWTYAAPNLCLNYIGEWIKVYATDNKTESSETVYSEVQEHYVRQEAPESDEIYPA